MKNPHRHSDGREPRLHHHPDGPFNQPEEGRPHRHRHSPGTARAGRRRGRRGRMNRGDVRAAILLLLAEEPMHGYQLMQAIADRTSGRWTPSPGAIYPAINQLEDEGLVTVTAESGRKVVVLTNTGREHVEASRDSWADPFSSGDDQPPSPDLRDLLGQLHEATRQVGRAGTEAQLDAAAKILSDARRSMYLLLAGGPGDADE